MTACAYFEEGKCIETMGEHIRRGLELIEGLYLRRNYGTLVGRLTGVEPEVAGELLLKAYVLHDVGKCLEVYQERREKFGHHEFYSYLVARKVLLEFGTAGEVASVAILLHHHDWIRRDFPKKPPSLRLAEGCLQAVERLFGDPLPPEVPWEEPAKEYIHVEEVLRKNLRAVYAFLMPIVIADNYSAALNRGGRGSLLGREILDSTCLRLLQRARLDEGQNKRWGWDFAGRLPGGV